MTQVTLNAKNIYFIEYILRFNFKVHWVVCGSNAPLLHILWHFLNIKLNIEIISIILIKKVWFDY